MAGEFTKRVENNQTIWKCANCGQDIISNAKPRGHICGEHVTHPPFTPSSASNSSTPIRRTPTSAHRHAFQHPPPGYQVQMLSQQAQNELSHWQQVQMMQAEQHKQMMIMLREQNQNMLQLQQDQAKIQQEQMQSQRQQDEEKLRRMMEALAMQKQEKRIKCPKWEKNENPKHFFSRLKRWDSIEKGKGKYLQFLESLQESGRLKEKLRVELEEQNGLINPDDDDVVTIVIDKLEKWYGKTKIHEASEAWKEFKNIKRNDGESIDDFLLRFDTVESKLKSTATELPALVSTLHLLEAVDVSSDQRQNILVNVNVENTDTILDELKSSLRLLKGNLVETTKIYNEEEVNFNRNDISNRGRSRSRGKREFYSRLSELNHELSIYCQTFSYKDTHS